jgi:predicted DNA-binding helix-hairpin-helix protein
MPMQEKNLTTRQINALCLLLERKDFSPEDVARLDYHTLMKTPGIGGKSVYIIRAWLTEYGLDLHNSPAEFAQSLRQLRLRVRLERAEQLLRKYGYAVQAPMVSVPKD